MALSNYTELQAAVADWLDRTDLTTQIVDFIRLAEAKMNMGFGPPGKEVRLRVREMAQTDDYLLGTTDDDVTRAVHPVPDDYIEMIEYRPTGTWEGDDGLETVTTGDYYTLHRYSSIHVQDHVEAGGGQPTDFSVSADGASWNVWPLGANWQMTAYYYGEVPPLASNATNDVLSRYPDVYLFGALAMAEEFLTLKDVNYTAQFISAIDSANRTERKAAYSGSTLTIQPVHASTRAR